MLKISDLLQRSKDAYQAHSRFAIIRSRIFMHCNLPAPRDSYNLRNVKNTVIKGVLSSDCPECDKAYVHITLNEYINVFSRLPVSCIHGLKIFSIKGEEETTGKLFKSGKMVNLPEEIFQLSPDNMTESSGLSVNTDRQH